MFVCVPMFMPGANRGQKKEYDVLDKKRARDPEMGGKQVGNSCASGL